MTRKPTYEELEQRIGALEGQSIQGKQAETQLRESEERYRRITDGLTDYQYTVRIENGRTVETKHSPACVAVTGYTAEEFAANHYLWIRMVVPEDRELIRRRVEQILGGHDIRAIEHRLIRKDGELRWVSDNIILFRNDSGTILSYDGVVKDITERKQAEEERKTLEERLQRAEKMEILGRLAGGVAHDLNNVLGILSGYSELLLVQIPEDDRSRSYVEKIMHATGRGAAIIQDLLTMARRSVMVSEVLNLNSIVSDFFKTPVIDKLQPNYPRVTFRTECDRNLLNIKGSSSHLEKALMNLVSNAAEAISEAGEVAIQTENRYLDKPVRGYDEIKEGDYAVLTVSDTGAGIPDQHIENIFEPFYMKKVMGRSGTGLGLAIVWGTVIDHNGYIDVHTEIGAGTSFALYFPVAREELIVPESREPVEQYMGNGESVLVVDDIAGQRDIAAGLLKRLGYSVHVVSSGEDAVVYLKMNRADILVLDMIMDPGMDGLETYEQVLEINPKQKAIIVSGFSETERVRGAQKLGAGAYVRKPYILEKIGVAIRNELNR